MKSTLTEGKFLTYIVGAIFLLIGIHFFQPQLSSLYNPRDYIGIHTILEFFSISIAMTIFLYGLKNFDNTRSSEMLLLSFTFLTVGMIDILHTLSFKGMPYFLTESSVAKATWFWVFARVIESILMLVLIAFPSRKTKRDYRGLLSLAAIVITIVVAYVVIHFESNMPLLVVEGSGTTALKNGIEYFVGFLQFLSIIVVLYQYFLEKSETKMYIVLAFVFLLFSELIFTIYQSVYDLDNFSGHLFKVFGDYFILKGFYFTGSTMEKENTHQSIQNQPGIIFQLEERGSRFICSYCEGSLLASLDLTAEKLAGKEPAQLFAILGASFQEYCETPTVQDKPVGFITGYRDKIFFVSSKCTRSSQGTEIISGIVVDLSNAASMEAAVSLEKKQLKPDYRFW